jgi:hypothetical protein
MAKYSSYFEAIASLHLLLTLIIAEIVEQKDGRQ